MLGCEAYKDYVGEKAKRRKYHFAEAKMTKVALASCQVTFDSISEYS